MTTINAHSILGELVTADPSLARGLEHHGLDYCCGGTRTIAEACVTRGLDVDEVIAELTIHAEQSSPSWTSMSAADLVDHIEGTHHQYLWQELPSLSALVEKVATVHGARHPELDDVAECFDALRADLEPHLAKEEQVLFPMIRELAAATTKPSFHCGSLSNPIGVTGREHDAAGDLLARLRVLTDGYNAPADGCTSYQVLYQRLAALESDTHLHVHKENNVLFPMVQQLERQLSP